MPLDFPSTPAPKETLMLMDELIKLTENRLTILNEQKRYHVQMRDVDKVTALETEIYEAETTLIKLKSV